MASSKARHTNDGVRVFVPEAGHFPVHTAPLAQCAWGTSSQSEVADEAGDGGGEVFNPSTWMKAAQSTGEAGDAALRIFLDLVIMGKALSGGLPLSAVAAGERFLGQWPAGMHTSTFQGNPLACAMAVATLDTILNDDLLAYVRSVIAPLLSSALMPLRDNPGVTDIRVAGAQAAISFCTPDGQPDPARAQALQRAMLDRQILVYGGGKSGECLMLVPPLNLAAEPLSRALADLVMLIDAKEDDIPLG